jgi:ribosomal protein L28
MKTTYRCQLCGNTVTLHVNVSHPPTCWNPNKHTGKRVNMNILTPTTDTKRR